MKFYVELFSNTGGVGLTEEVEADFYKKEDGFVTFYGKQEAPKVSEGGLILSTSTEGVEVIIADYNERVVRFISSEITRESDENF